MMKPKSKITACLVVFLALLSTMCLSSCILAELGLSSVYVTEYKDEDDKKNISYGYVGTTCYVKFWAYNAEEATVHIYRNGAPYNELPYSLKEEFDEYKCIPFKPTEDGKFYFKVTVKKSGRTKTETSKTITIDPVL